MQLGKLNGINTKRAEKCKKSFFSLVRLWLFMKRQKRKLYKINRYQYEIIQQTSRKKKTGRQTHS